ncbi:MAG: hypothetical protein QM817_37405 [Archangium sp.]
MSGFDGYIAAVREALSAVAERALKPAPRVAQHWESTSRLAWFGAAADHHLIHVSWSFGLLKERGTSGSKRDTVGVFSITKSTFPEVDDAELRAQADALIPPGTDGATRVFLQRVMAQMAVGDALLTLQSRVGCDISLFARTDASDTAALTPRWPEHARDRVANALMGMEAPLRTRVEVLFDAGEDTLLEALRARR